MVPFWPRLRSRPKLVPEKSSVLLVPLAVITGSVLRSRTKSLVPIPPTMWSLPPMLMNVSLPVAPGMVSPISVFEPGPPMSTSSPEPALSVTEESAVLLEESSVSGAVVCEASIS